MNVLHNHFLLRQQQTFQRVLDGSVKNRSSKGHSSNTSGGKSSGSLSSAPLAGFDVNARDTQGRTVLHLAASATDSSASEYVRMLLTHPKINPNVRDKESGWTPLHRALYHGNLASARLLLQRADIDIFIKDFEGYTAFDLYNSTVEGTKPEVSGNKLRAQLFTWGANRNAALGHGDSEDKSFPDQVSFESNKEESVHAPLRERLASIHVEQVAMSKLHTAVITSEPKSNLRACGFGSGGRLGPGQHTQYSLLPLPQFHHSVVSVALGQDHTLALTTNGEVFSWGLNRFSQLGYVIELSPGANSKLKEPIQAVAKKVNALKGEIVRGVAACKTASACWTQEEVYSWGTNSGQLGYDKKAHPVQIFPRVVTRISQPVLGVTLTDNAMACLLNSHDVVCIFNDSHFRVNFPAFAFPAEIAPYRPPQAIRNTSIEKVVSCDNLFAALTSNGELFTFNLSTSSEVGIAAGKSREVIKPQRVWALRKKFTSVKDVDLGADGSIIICTDSGHVYVRDRTLGKSSKFQRVPELQRVVKVAANSTGAFGALRVDAKPESLEPVKNTLAQDVAKLQPYLANLVPMPQTPEPTGVSLDALASSTQEESQIVPDLEEQDASISTDTEVLLHLCILLERHKVAHDDTPNTVLSGKGPFAHGADLLINVQSGSKPWIPAHKFILAARCPPFRDTLKRGYTLADTESRVKFRFGPPIIGSSSPASPTSSPWINPSQMTVSGCHPLTILVLLVYLYSDQLLSLWDWRVAQSLQPHLTSLKISPVQLKTELQACARLLQLPHLVTALRANFKRELPPSMVLDIQQFAAQSPILPQFAENSPLKHDTVLLLADRSVLCHSVVLRARSPFFSSFFSDEDWTHNRWTAGGTIVVDFKHLNWRQVEFVLQYLYGGNKEMFERLPFVHSADELLELMFDIMAAANEMYLDPLIQLCSRVILQTVTISNAGYILAEASYYNAPSLANSIKGYIAQTLEALLEGRILDDLPYDLIKQLSSYVREQQARKLPITRSEVLVQTALEKYSEWLSTEDFPQPITHRFPRPSPSEIKLSPPTLPRADKVPPDVDCDKGLEYIPPPPLPTSKIPDDAVFAMDDVYISPSAPVTPPPAPEKVIQKADMKTIMAETETIKVSTSSSLPSSITPRSRVSSDVENWRTPQRILPPDTLQHSPRPTSSSPWKVNPTPPAVSLASSPPVMRMTPITSSHASTRAPDRPSGAMPSRATTAVTGSPSPIPSQVPTPFQASGIGPVFSPTKQPTAKATQSAGMRRASGGNSVWTLPPVQPSAPSTSSGPIMSFTAIQQLQLEQNAPIANDKRSLKEIQEEERDRQIEEDFMKWWAAEEERVRLEEASPPLAPKRGREKARRGKGRGKDTNKGLEGSGIRQPNPRPESSGTGHHEDGLVERSRDNAATDVPSGPPPGDKGLTTSSTSGKKPYRRYKPRRSLKQDQVDS